MGYKGHRLTPTRGPHDQPQPEVCMAVYTNQNGNTTHWQLLLMYIQYHWTVIVCFWDLRDVCDWVSVDTNDPLWLFRPFLLESAAFLLPFFWVRGESLNITSFCGLVSNWEVLLDGGLPEEDLRRLSLGRADSLSEWGSGGSWWEGSGLRGSSREGALAYLGYSTVVLDFFCCKCVRWNEYNIGMLINERRWYL